MNSCAEEMASHFLLAISMAAGALQAPARRTVLSGGAAAWFLAARPPHALAKDYPITVDWESLPSGPFYILRRGGAEPPNSSPLVGEEREGTYACAACLTPLFASSEKFASGDGYPSFAGALPGVETGGRWWASQLHLSSEVRCAACGGHVGDYFTDGAAFVGTRAQDTGTRFCVDGAALVFLPKGEGDAVSGDGLTRRRTEDPSLLISPPSLRLPRTARRA